MALDKSFGFSAKYELGKEVGRGHFGASSCGGRSSCSSSCLRRSSRSSCCGRRERERRAGDATGVGSPRAPQAPLMADGEEEVRDDGVQAGGYGGARGGGEADGEEEVWDDGVQAGGDGGARGGGEADG